MCEKKQRINSIDSLRGIACIIIAFFWHYLNMQPKGLGMPFQSIFSVFYDYGQYFVELFFMISGFVMAYCYKEKIITGENFFSYMIKRYKYLYPLFFTTLMYMVVFQTFYNSLTGTYYVYKASVFHFVLNLLCMQTGWFTTDQSFNGPAWFVSVQIFLYIIFYVTTYITKKNNNLYTILICIFGGVSTAIVYRGIGDFPFLNLFTIRGVSCFYIGALICEFNNWLDKDKKNEMANSILIIFIIFRLLILLLPNWSFWESENNGRFMLIIFEWPILIFASINCELFRKVLEIKPLLYLGKISLDIFLWHVPVQITIKTIDKFLALDINYGSRIIWLIYIVFVLLVSAFSYYFRSVNNRYIFKSLMTVILCCLILVGTDLLGVRMKTVVNSSLSYSDMNGCVEMRPGIMLEEEFYNKKNSKLEKIEFYPVTWNKSFLNEQVMVITIFDMKSNELIYQIERNLNRFGNGVVYILEIDENVNLEDDTWYRIKYETNTSEDQEFIGLLTTNVSDNKGTLYYAGNQFNSMHVSQKIWVK